MGEDDRKRIVLARRAKFVAAALAGAAATTSCLDSNGTGGNPQPCLSLAVEGGPPPPSPQPCLTAPNNPPPDAGPDADASADADAASDADAD
jgi:hypothetical protein